MESIQLAQMLADLSDLNAAQESQAAVNLVNANKTLTTPAAATASTSAANGSVKPPEHAAIRPGQRHHQRVASSNSVGGSRTNSPAKFDTIGRRILTPPLSRSNSAQGSIPGTPRREAEFEDDVDRASSLMALYEIRAKLKQQDNTSLGKLRDKIAALKARQDAEKKAGGGGLGVVDAHHGTGPGATRPGLHSRYTYPKSPLETDSDNNVD